MKKCLTLGTFVLVCYLAAAAQVSPGVEPRDFPATTPAPYPQNEKIKVQGCLSQSPDGNFILADKSGNNFQLSGDTSKLSSLMGSEVRVAGTAWTSAPRPGAMASGAPAEPVIQISVSKVRKVAGSCASGSSTSK